MWSLTLHQMLGVVDIMSYFSVHLQMLLWWLCQQLLNWRMFFFFSSLCSFCADSEKDDVEPGNGIAQWRLNEQLFPCPVCGKVFGRQQTLSRHLALHTGKYTQGVCMAGFMGVIVDVCVYMFNSCSH